MKSLITQKSGHFRVFAIFGLLSFSSLTVAQQSTPRDSNSEQPYSEELHHEDPTKVITKLGVGYNEQATFSGSLSVDKTRKLNAKINDDNSHWSIGGSWLFTKGIVNFSVRHNDLDHGAEKDGYSLGTSIPLSKFGFKPYDIQVFAMLGVSKNEGDFAIPNPDVSDELENDYILMPNSSKGGYISYFAFKPISDKWTVMSFGGTSRGSEDYKGYWFGGGLSYKIDSHQSVNSYAFMWDDDFDADEKIGLSYTYEFDGLFIK